MIKAIFFILLTAMLISPSCALKEIGVQNGCCENIQVALHVLAQDGNWRNFGWYSYSPCEKVSYIEKDGIRIETNNNIFYYYAESTDGSVIWSGNDLNVDFKGRTLSMRKATFGTKDGNFYYVLDCPDISPCGNQCDSTTFRDELPSKSAWGCQCGNIVGGE